MIRTPLRLSRRNRFQSQSFQSRLQKQSQVDTIRHLCIKYRVIIYCGFIVLVLLELHRNFIHESYIDRLFVTKCVEESAYSAISCSICFGFIENMSVFIILSASYLLFFPCYWRLRYLHTFTCCESDSLAFLDPFIMSFPWFLSPLFLFHSITSLIIDSCMIAKSTEDDTLSAKCNLIRTFWSFALWCGLDLFLWSNFSMSYLFEKGPNKIFEMILPQHFKYVKQILSPHLCYIDDLVEIILTFEGNDIVWRLVEMKQNIAINLSQSNLSQPFYYLAIITVIMSALRLLITPGVISVLFPMIVAFGIFVIILALFLLLIMMLVLFTGDSNSAPHCDCTNECNSCFAELRKCSQQSIACKACTGLIGVLVAVNLWGFIIWKIMNMKLRKLNVIQKQSKSMHMKLNDEAIELYVGSVHRDLCK